MFAVVHDEVPSSFTRKPTLALQEFNGEDLTPSVQVYLPHNLRPREFLRLFTSSTSTFKPAFTFPALQNWFSKLNQNLKLQDHEDHPFHKHPYRLREIEIQAVDWFWRNKPGKEDKLGFMKIQAKIETDPYLHDGEESERADWLPGAVFLRGGSVAMLIILQPEDAKGDQEKYVILTIQPRIAAGSLAFTEIPAGMLDGNTFQGTAATEIEEEAGLKVKESDLINLTELALEDIPVSPWKTEESTTQTDSHSTVEEEEKDDDDDDDDKDSEDQSFTTTTSAKPATESTENGIYPSPGACDEFIPLFLCQKRLTRKHVGWLKGKATGLRDEGENITLRLVPLDKAWRYVGRDAKALAALTLYENLKKEGRIDDMPQEVEDEPDELRESNSDN
ncbi:hypothetical protein T440DRAFT_497702 [Plenodomus tracheiphilus IPT5]|uniref:Uncharacterized protein n=1 Tax=Plenodomus tracheiphilus IPT5 TaxID=1408161 RepID=A0A6A7BBB2_9PLEO|nr:hypothetical protein T440DRAFT_497702 [Plenodomus tracheiphilus IPT5]